MIASLMMYARSQLDAAHARFWQLIRENLAQAGIDAPEELSQTAEEFSVWKDPDLVLSQTCGMPYRTWLHDQVNLVGTPDYGLDGCPPGYYRSALMVRADAQSSDIADFKSKTFAYNQTFSQSGYAAPYWHLKSRGIWFQNSWQSEGHLNSARSVVEGLADIASLDAVSWRLMREYEEFAQDLRVLEWTNPTPGLPLITSTKHDPEVVFDAVSAAITQLTPDDQTALGIKGLVRIPKEDYLAIPNPPGSV
ncbi:PhnD/SsuA/transferrin family substrate-binding protein [Thalassobius sp. I31.1]|uniref:phosphate/phosphite/phosphonate ABC transporter substrate-binding protein n=1 Tax=Thalassobius sp. I31.1 TaxID=2109912 RepID=UPI000D1B09A5|nr:PhnD/SsuA/transferrin family substrate-binding protein [Thalassobius sp. I31.1]